MKEQSNELKPCPFCGSTRVMVQTNITFKGECATHCFYCGTFGPFCEDKNEAIARWNRRAYE